MKKLSIKKCSNNVSSIKIPKGFFRSGNTFECTVCGATWEKQTFDNYVDCPYCGGYRTGIRQD